jgi:hypothetical protein
VTAHAQHDAFVGPVHGLSVQHDLVRSPDHVR